MYIYLFIYNVNNQIYRIFSQQLFNLHKKLEKVRVGKGRCWKKISDRVSTAFPLTEEISGSTHKSLVIECVSHEEKGCC